MFGLGLFGPFMMILFWILIIGLIVWAVREIAGKDEKRSGSSALNILKERYAKGEISKEQFEAMKKDILN